LIHIKAIPLKKFSSFFIFLIWVCFPLCFFALFQWGLRET
jgi:hypothetical protein